MKKYLILAEVCFDWSGGEYSDAYIPDIFLGIEEFENEVLKTSNDDHKDILEIVTKFLPFISQVTMSDNIAQHNIENLLINKIEELKKDHKNNQYKLFILYFILMDIDENNILKFTDEILSLMEINVLKYSQSFKSIYS